jgi:DNA polymerase III subunit epsilon
VNRLVVLDTETTGLEPKLGHRIIEIAAVEIQGRKLTGNHFHRYLNPDREIDAGALEVHGISLEFLKDKPRFPDILSEFLDFIRDADLAIHNASFDVGFLNYELALMDAGKLEGRCTGVIDTLKMAREMHPGQKNNLDALCRRYGVDNSARTLHGALLDAELLAEVYLAMTRGQESLDMDICQHRAVDSSQAVWSNFPLKVLRANFDEMAEHRIQLNRIAQTHNDPALWDTLEQES